MKTMPFVLLMLTALVGLTAPAAFAVEADFAADLGEVTFHKDIAPILQGSCQACHKPDSVAPMALITYDQVRPYAKTIVRRTHMGPVAGVMPPWYIEKNTGIQNYQLDPSLSELELAQLAKWVKDGAPQGDPADAPPPLDLTGSDNWTIGEPDLVIITDPVTMKADSPDWWGEIAAVPTNLKEDRYVEAIEIREINDVLDSSGEKTGRSTVGGRFIFHHMIWSTIVLPEGADAAHIDAAVTAQLGTSWPVHEVGRNADTFDPEGARLLKAGSTVVTNSVHLHSNGRDTTARLEIGWKFHPKGYKPKYVEAVRTLGNAVDIDIKPNQANQELHAYVVLPEHTRITTFEPHLHAPGARMCLEAIWGIHIETLSCAGYDHNWVRGYEYERGYEPLLPKGTILHITGFMDNTDNNRNIPDPRNWQGSGNRSTSNLFIDLGHGVAMCDEMFLEAMRQRREERGITKNDHVIGCPLCNVFREDDETPSTPTAAGGE
ncbi:MAG: hypothetical protein VYE73_10850 [Acidobacteriota bacterium]|nr:hypothetical protein [Acidobacteriota bacterium]